MRAAALAALALCGSIAQASPSQIPFNAPGSVVSSDEFITTYKHAGKPHTTHKHKHFPKHAVRIVKPTICDDVNQWSGYLETPHGHNLFFWFFESRNDPENDPTMLWLNGGPGCSSFTGLLMEGGPCRVQAPGINDTVTLAVNEHSWNKNASVFFLDQPVGTGYSYHVASDKGVWTTEQARVDVHAFLQIFFSVFKQFANNPFHISGESYAGHYIPFFGEYIVEQNKIDNGLPKIPLESVLIGNGFSNPSVQYQSYYPLVCKNETSRLGKILSDEACEGMEKALPRCKELTDLCESDVSNTLICAAAVTYCEDTQTAPYYETGRNAYDMRRFIDYPESAWIAKFLNYPSTRHMLGVDHESHGGVEKFIGCSDVVGFRFAATGDQGHPSYPGVRTMLANGVRVLIYAGDTDFICSFYGNEAWTLLLDWSGKDAYNNASQVPWYTSDGSEAGYFRSYSNLTFATVANSGHFVPTDQPLSAIEMVNAWNFGGPSAFADLLARKPE